MHEIHNRRQCNRPPAVRVGITVIELTIAIAIFAMLLATSMKMIFLASNQVRANERRNVALQTVQAVSEQLENTPWDRLTTETASQTPLPNSVATYLPGAKLSVVVNDETDLTAKRVLVELTWNGRGDERAGPVRLTSWIFPPNVQPAQ